MTEYQDKECSVCRRKGGIERRTQDLFVCSFCGTPFRVKATQKPDKVTETRKRNYGIERFVWFTYINDEGEKIRGIYDCPRLDKETVKVLSPDRNKMSFLKYLVSIGKLTEEVESVDPADNHQSTRGSEDSS